LRRSLPQSHSTSVKFDENLLARPWRPSVGAVDLTAAMHMHPAIQSPPQMTAFLWLLYSLTLRKTKALAKLSEVLMVAYGLVGTGARVSDGSGGVSNYGAPLWCLHTMIVK
jgi:hypothetical protein